MAFKTFKMYCEQNAVANSATPAPTVNTGFSNEANKSFDQVVDPLIDNFTRNVIAYTLNQYYPQLQTTQIQYILDKIKKSLSETVYDPRKDLRNIVNNIFRNRNQPQAQRNTAQAETTPYHPNG